MSDGEVEVESPTGYSILPKDVTAEIGSVKLFNKWSYEDVEIRDISLTYGFPPSRNTHLLDMLDSRMGLVYNWECVANSKSAATTSRSARPSTSLTPLADMPSSDSGKHSAPSSSVLPTRS
jgi:hypothetical protein